MVRKRKQSWKDPFVHYQATLWSPRILPRETGTMATMPRTK